VLSFPLDFRVPQLHFFTHAMSKIVFITGTDTGVGKTVLTALLLRYLRDKGVNALAMKPFCSGGREDAELLHALQGDEVTLDEVNPFYFSQPVSPWVAAKKTGQVPLKAALKKIAELKNRCDVLLIEGSGGVIVPLGDGYVVLDLIRALKCSVLVASRNRLGTINHTLLTVNGLQHAGIKRLAVALVDSEKSDFSSRTNLDAITKWGNGIRQLRVFGVPYIGKRASSLRGIARAEKKVKKVLAGIWKCL
jgi:dethiobiotin synthetase